jgi:hypothetical protein
VDELDKILWDAEYNSFHADFQPNLEHIAAVLPVLKSMQGRLVAGGLVNEEEAMNIRIAMGCLIAHIEHAYPDLNEVLKRQSEENYLEGEGA